MNILFYGGVDIFVFASGIGAYYSFSKDEDILEFLKRKFIRIYPTYILFIVPWLIYNVIFNSFTLKEIVANIFLVSSFTAQRDFNWYIGFLIRIYILSPIFVTIINKIDNKKFVVFISGLFLLSVPSWGADGILVRMARYPLFALGIWIGKRSKQGAHISFKGKVVGSLSLIGGCIILLVCSYYFPDNIKWHYGFFFIRTF